MSWSRLVASGQGLQRFRLLLEGYQVSWVTDRDMEASMDNGQTKKAGLKGDSLVFEERVYPAEARIELQSCAVTIVDRNDAATSEFTRLATATTYLTESIDDAGTELTLLSTAGFAENDVVHIGTEAMLVTSIDSDVKMTVTRAVWFTSAQYHYVENGESLQYPEVTNAPVLLQGRRAWIYAYGAGDNYSTGDGTLVWQGRVLSEPTIDDELHTWTVNISAIDSVFDQKLAARAEELLYVQGIYYSWRGPLVVQFGLYPGATLSGSPTIVGDDIGGSTLVLFTGRYATQEEFATAFAALLNTRHQGIFGTDDGVWNVFADSDGWHVSYTTAASSPRFPYFECYSNVDGKTERTPLNESGNTVNTVGNETTYSFPWDVAVDDALLSSVIPITPRHRTRANYAPFFVIPARGFVVAAADSTTAPDTRLYLDRASTLSAGDQLHIGNDELTSSREVDTVSTAENYVDLLAPVTASLSGDHPVTVAQFYAVGTLADFRDQLVADAPTSNSGATPHITANDIASWSDAVAGAAAGRPYLQDRNYVFTKPVDLREVLEHECRLYGLFPYVDSDGKIALRTYAPPTPTDVTTADITPASHDVKLGLGRLDLTGDGVLNVVRIKNGYDVNEDEHTGEEWIVRDNRSISRLHREQALDIAPKVKGTTEPTFADAVHLASGVLALYGNRYALVTLNVPRSMFHVLCGDTVSLTINRLPFEGVRGLSEKRGMVVGKRWAMGEAHGTLTIMITGLNIAGYAPTGRIASQSNITGNQWDITLEASRYSPGVDASYFEAGYVVKVKEWDDASPTTVQGTVDSVVGNVVRVTFTGTWTPGASVWNLLFAGSADVTVEQLRYCYCAGDDGKIDNAGTDVTARVFAP